MNKNVIKLVDVARNSDRSVRSRHEWAIIAWYWEVLNVISKDPNAVYKLEQLDERRRTLHKEIPDRKKKIQIVKESVDKATKAV